MNEYPLMENAGESLRAASGRKVEEITPEALAAGELTADDLRIRAETLRAQAGIAAASGYPQLAANLRRAAELTALPNDELLRAYEMLRPGRATSGGATRAGRSAGTGCTRRRRRPGSCARRRRFMRREG